VATRICLDTDVMMEFLRGKEATVQKIRHYITTEELCITSVTFFELLASVNKKGRVIRIIDNLSLLPFDKKASLRADKVNEKLRESKVDAGVRDVMNASICLANDALLLTHNRPAYEGMEGLKFV